MKKSKIKKQNLGQSMFEVILALFIITLIIVAVVILATISISNALFSKNQTLASKYSQEAIEWLRSEKESDINNFLVKLPLGTGNYCFNSISLSFANSGVCGSTEIIPNTIFTREMEYSHVGNRIAVTVTTSWTDSKGLHEVSTATDFTDRREVN